MASAISHSPVVFRQSEAPCRMKQGALISPPVCKTLFCRAGFGRYRNNAEAPSGLHNQSVSHKAWTAAANFQFASSQRFLRMTSGRIPWSVYAHTLTQLAVYGLGLAVVYCDYQFPLTLVERGLVKRGIEAGGIKIKPAGGLGIRLRNVRPVDG